MYSYSRKVIAISTAENSFRKNKKNARIISRDLQQLNCVAVDIDAKNCIITFSAGARVR